MSQRQLNGLQRQGKGLDKPIPAGAMVWQCKVLEEALGVRKRATLCVDLQKLLRFAPWRRRVEYVVVPQVQHVVVQAPSELWEWDPEEGQSLSGVPDSEEHAGEGELDSLQARGEGRLEQLQHGGPDEGEHAGEGGLEAHQYPCKGHAGEGGLEDFQPRGPEDCAGWGLLGFSARWTLYLGACWLSGAASAWRT